MSKFSVGDQVKFVVPADEVNRFDPNGYNYDGDWADITFTPIMSEYINQVGELRNFHQGGVDSAFVSFGGRTWWIPLTWLEVVETQPTKQAQPTLYLIRGVPGSGKSTLAQQLFDCGLVAAIYEADSHFVKEDGSYVFEPKQLSRAHGLCQSRAYQDLEAGNSVAVSNTSTTEKEVAVYQQMAEELGVKFVSIVVESRHNGKNQHGVPEEKLQQMRNRFSLKL